MNYLFQSKIISIPLMFCFLVSVLLTGCFDNSSQIKNDSSLSVEDIKKIKDINKDYTQGWLENDAEKVLSLYADSSMIIPSGLLPIEGKKAITDFWFPNDGSITTIHYYELEILDIKGSHNLAYTYEHGDLSFSYEKEDFKMERKAQSYAITVYNKNEFGEWKIIKRIWTDLNN